MTTYAEFLTSLGNLHIAGVTRHYRYGEGPPASLKAADLPAAWLQLPEGEQTVMAFAGGAGWPAMKAQLVVAVLPTAHSTLAAAFAATVVMMDAVTAALRPVTPAKSKPTWAIKSAVVTVAGTDYWAVVAEVSANG